MKTTINLTYEWWTTNGRENDVITHALQLDEVAEREIAHYFEKGFTSGYLEHDIGKKNFKGFWQRNTIREGTQVSIELKKALEQIEEQIKKIKKL